MHATEKPQSIAAYDNAPFFEKAFKYAVEHNIIDATRIDEIANDAATGAVQITEYFGESTHLRKNLETSMKRMVSLVSLYLEDATGSALDKAAMLLKEKPFRSLSRGGSQMLKALFSLPEDGHFGSARLDSERDFLKKSLVKGMSVTKYRQTIKDCEQFKKELDFAIWLVKKLGAPISKLNEFHASAEHVIRTALLALAYGTKKVGGNKTSFPDEAALFEIFSAMRKEWGFLGDITCSTKFIDEVPAEFIDYANTILAAIKTEDIPKIVNPSIPLQSVFSDLKDRKYCYLQDHFNEMSKFDKMLAADWFALTGATEDDALLLTLFLCAASGLEQKTALKVNEAKKAVLSIREHGVLQSNVLKLIEMAPHDEIEQLRSLWSDFIEEATPFLLDHSDENLKEVMVYLEDHCNIQKAKK